LHDSQFDKFDVAMNSNQKHSIRHFRTQFDETNSQSDKPIIELGLTLKIFDLSRASVP